jgi:hypothetical protein
MFGAYTSSSEIDGVVGRSWRRNCYTQVGVSDGYTLLVFTKDDNVVHCLDYPKEEGDFLIPEQRYHEGLSSHESHFLVNEYGQLIWAANSPDQ